MKNDPIADLEALDRRWPGLFDVWRAMNGHGELADGYGFIHKGLIDMKARVLECESVLNSVDSSKEEIEKAVMGLKEVRAASQKFAIAREAGLVRAAAMINEMN